MREVDPQHRCNINRRMVTAPAVFNQQVKDNYFLIQQQTLLKKR